MFLVVKNRCTDSIVRRRIVMVKQPVLVPPSFQTLSVDLLPQTLQNIQVIKAGSLFGLEEQIPGEQCPHS
jgi:hypothetical protein